MNVWAARSPCTPDCVRPHTARVPAATALRRSAALTRVVAGAAADSGRLADPAVLRGRAEAVLDALGIGLELRCGPPGAGAWDGPPSADLRGGVRLSVPGGTGTPETGTLVVANHISWVDVIALLAVEPVTMLAKRQVGQWPLLGGLVRRAGTLFIDRDSLRELPATVARMAALLRSGTSLMVFPQGVTWCHGTGGPFRRATFQAALDAGAPIRPVTLEYFQRRDPTTVAAFLGDEDFAGSLRRVLRAADLTARLTVHPPLHPVPGLHDRRALAAQARAAVAGSSAERGGTRPKHLDLKSG